MFDYKDKKRNVRTLNNYMLTRTLSMFDWSGLPDTIPEVEIEKQLQKYGYTFITEVEGDLYALNGNFSGERNPYGLPTKININNASLNFNKELDIEKDGTLIINDDLMLGLMPLYDRSNTLLVENEITMFLNTYNSRIQMLLSSGDDKTKQSAELFISKLIDGEIGVIGENRLFEGIKTHSNNTGQTNQITSLIEFNQYIKATLYNEVGLNANFNMKRERLNSSEVDMNSEQLRPLVDNMLKARQKSIERLNSHFNLDVSVDFGSIWKIKTDDITETETVETEIESGQEGALSGGSESTVTPLEDVDPNQLSLNLDDGKIEVIEDDN